MITKTEQLATRTTNTCVFVVRGRRVQCLEYWKRPGYKLFVDTVKSGMLASYQTESTRGEER